MLIENLIKADNKLKPAMIKQRIKDLERRTSQLYTKLRSLTCNRNEIFKLVLLNQKRITNLLTNYSRSTTL